MLKSVFLIIALVLSFPNTIRAVGEDERAAPQEWYYYVDVLSAMWGWDIATQGPLTLQEIHALRFAIGYRRMAIGSQVFTAWAMPPSASGGTNDAFSVFPLYLYWVLYAKSKKEYFSSDAVVTRAGTFSFPGFTIYPLSPIIYLYAGGGKACEEKKIFFDAGLGVSGSVGLLSLALRFGYVRVMYFGETMSSERFYFSLGPALGLWNEK